MMGLPNHKILRGYQEKHWHQAQVAQEQFSAWIQTGPSRKIAQRSAYFTNTFAANVAGLRWPYPG